MLKLKAVFSGFSVDDLDKATAFYADKLGLKVVADAMGLRLHLPGGGEVFVYAKDNHQPAAYTMLNLVVDDIDQALDELQQHGITLERYEGMPQDEKGVVRGRAHHKGPDIAWFKDPAGNIIGVLQPE